MAIIKNNYSDLISKAQGGDNLPYAKVLTQRNMIMKEARFNYCNKDNTFIYNVQQQLPEATSRSFYKGVVATHGKKTQVVSGVGNISSRSEVDSSLLEQEENKSQFRIDEAADHLEAMSQEFSRRFFYGNTDLDPASFNGLAKFYNKKSGQFNSAQVIDAGGVGLDNTSIYFVGWGTKKTCLIHPKGSMAGLKRTNEGRENITDTINGGTFYAEVETFNWDVGLAICDFRYVVRIANIDVDSMQNGDVKLFELLRRAYYQFEAAQSEDPGVVSAIYMNRDVKEALDMLSTNGGTGDNNVRLTPMDIQGKMVDTYREIPIRTTDALMNTEQKVV